MYKSFLLVLLSFLSYTSLWSQLVINEVCAANYSDYAVGGENHDWFEIYNPSGSDIDIAGYYISDNILDPTVFQVPSSIIVPANGYLLVFASGLDGMIGGNIHTNFRITQGKQEYAVLSDPSGSIIDTWWLENSNQENHSFGRLTDGAAQWGVFTNPSPGASNSGGFTSYADRPTFSIDAGLYSGSTTVSLTSAASEIRYTTDGSTPTSTSTLYSTPISINTTTVLRARSFSNDPMILPSFVETNTYFVNETSTLKIISISGDQVMDFIQDIAPGAFDNNFKGAFEYFDASFNLIDEGSGDYNKHGNDSWAYDQRGIDFIMRDEFGYNNTIHDPIFNLSNKDEFQRIIIKAAANDNYPAENGAHIRDAYIHELSMRANLELDERTYEPCVLYVDGEYWGVYEIREKADDIHYTRYYYNQGPGSVDYLKTWGATWSEMGNGQGDWDALVNYILTNDMTVDANYQYVTTQLNTGSLIDYFILNSYVVTSDWLNWNTAWWRGTNPAGGHQQWGYVLWDMDASFGHYINYTGVPSQDPDADPCDPETLGDPGGQGHVPILNALFANEDFYQDYISRYADLSAGALSCANMHAILDELVARIEPEMPSQIARWGGTIGQWENNVQAIHDFIDERCIEIEQGIVDCYNVDGPFQVMVDVQPPGAGWVGFNTIDITTTPWTGSYYGGLDVDLEATPYGTNIFSHWELNNHTIFDPTSDTASFTFSTNDTIVAYFVTTTTDLTLEVVPDVAGSIDFLNNNYITFPTIVDTPEGVDLVATTNSLGNYFVFDHWELANNTISTDPSLPDVTINIQGEDTLTAIYTELPNYTLTIVTEGSDDAFITIEGDTIEDNPFTDQYLGDIDYTITANAPDHYHFVEWILDNNTLSTDPDFDISSFILSANDTLTAIFEEDSHFFLTLQTNPENAGEIKLNQLTINTLPYTKKIYEDEASLQIDALPFEHFDFIHWTSYHHDFGNDSEHPSVGFNIISTDTITANFYAHPFGFWLPNAFSPNEDGINDLWKAHGSSVNIDRYEVQVFDRWGHLLFNSLNFDEGWNGDGIDKKGYYSNTEVYTYKIKVQSAIDGAQYEYTGIITLVR